MKTGERQWTRVEFILTINLRPRAHIKAQFSGMGKFTPINTVLLDDLEVVEMDTSELID